MIDFANTVTIDRAISEVYGYLADLRHVPEWNWAIEATEQITPGAIGVGTTYRQTRHTPARSVEILRIIALEPSQLIALSGDLGPFSSTVTYTLRPSGASTQVDNRIQLEPRGPARIAAPVISGVVARSVAENLETLKRRLEHEDATKPRTADLAPTISNQWRTKRPERFDGSYQIETSATRRVTLPAVVYNRRT